MNTVDKIGCNATVDNTFITATHTLPAKPSAAVLNKATGASSLPPKPTGIILPPDLPARPSFTYTRAERKSQESQARRLKNQAALLEHLKSEGLLFSTYAQYKKMKRRRKNAEMSPTVPPAELVDDMKGEQPLDPAQRTFDDEA